MSSPKAFLDGEESSLKQLDLESHSSTISASSYSNDEMLRSLRSRFSSTAAGRGSIVDMDDYVLDYTPNPRLGCRRTYKIRSSGCRCNLGGPFGATYIFVQGKDSACIVARKQEEPQVFGELDRRKQEEPQVFGELDRILMSLADPPLGEFKKSSLGFLMSEQHGDLEHFAVVSVLLSPREIRQEIEFRKVSDSISSERVINLLKETPSRATLHEQSAVSTLQFKLANDAPFTFDETIQTAISAIQCLYDVLFQDDEIEVYAVGEAGRVNKLLEREEIGWHLAAIKTGGGSIISKQDISSSGGEALHSNAPIMGSMGGIGGLLADGIPLGPRDDPGVDSNDFVVGRGDFFAPREIDTFLPKGHEVESSADYAPKPGVAYKRTSLIRPSGSECLIRPPHGGTYIFVQGKQSACIVSRDPVKDKETGYDLISVLIGLADRRLKRYAILRRGSKEHVDVEPFAVVTAILNPNNLNDEKGFKPDSTHKDPGPRFVNEEAEESAISLLKQRLENGTINETIQTAISALQCLYRDNVKAHEIKVYAFRDSKLDFLAEEEIERHLTVINNE